MIQARLLRIGATVLALCSAGASAATTLNDAIALALKHDPGLQQAEARRDLARARLQQAKAERLPSVVASASAGYGPADFGQFFGFGRYDLKPRGLSLALQQPLYSGGAIAAGIDQATAAEASAGASVEDARLALAADVAEAYVGVQLSLRAREMVRSHGEALRQALEQARLRFRAGEIPRSEVDQAQARLSEAEAAVASADGDVARAAAHYTALCGEPPVDLAPAGEPPAVPATRADAVTEALSNSRAVRAAEAAVAAAEAGVRQARAGGLPVIALTAQASSARDQFLPGYRSDGVTVGVQGRWTLFDGGRTAGKVSEAGAGRRLAEADLAKARAAVEEGAVGAWQTRATADVLARAASDQVAAAVSAVDSIRQEVRVGERPTLDLLNAERELLAARLSLLHATGVRVVAAYRLNALVGREPDR